MLYFLLFILILLNCYENVNSFECAPGRICVPYHQCLADPSAWENGKELIDIRFDQFNLTNKCKHYLDVCCPNNYTISKDSALLDDRMGDYDTSDMIFECGRSNIGGIDFKITGITNDESDFGEFPWMIAIIKENLSNNQKHIDYICGGSLIHPSVVLTAAHSIIKFQNLTLIARAGEWDPRTDKEKYIHQDRKIKEIIIHNKYNKFLHFDIALLITSEPFELLQHIRPVCLPSPQMDFAKQNCIAIGWGEDEYGKEDEYSVILKKLKLQVIPLDICKGNIQKKSKFKTGLFQLHDSAICAAGIKGTKRNTCKGDGGSPLNCPIPGKKDLYYQSGIVSWGTGCSKNEPGVYTNIAYLRSWIDFVLAKRKLSFNNHNRCEGNLTCVPFYKCNGPSINISCEDHIETCCINSYILEDLSDYPETGITETNFKWKCGTRNENILPFANTGYADSIAEYGEFPWMVVILKEEKFENDEILNMYICGGSLIHPSVVLTAAHTVIGLKVENLLARGGDWDTQTNDEIYPHQNRNVKELIIHEKYTRVFHYDIAILILKTPFIMNINIIPICLPPPQMKFDNVLCIAIGHGKKRYGSEGKYAAILQKIYLSIIPSNICQNDINNKLSFKTSYELHDSFICAGGADGTKTNTCKGDGGGPLICPIPGRKGSFYQTGIVSWGTGCDKEDIGIYTNVAYLRSWIDFILAKRKLSYQFYTP